MAHKWDPRCPPPRGLVRPVPVDPLGIDGPTRRAAIGPLWRRTSRGLYVPADVTDDLPEQRILEQSMRLPAGGAVTGWAGCRLHGGNFFDGLGPDGRTRIPVPLAIGPRGNIRPAPDVTLGYENLPSSEVLVRHDIPTVIAERAVFDAMRRTGDLREAVVDLDMAMAAELTSATRLAAYAAGRGTARGLEVVTAALPLASEHSRSPNEVRLRLVWEIDLALPPLLVNCPVHDRHGRLLGVADLLDVAAGLALESDGAEHRTAKRHTRDVAKDEAFRNVGLELCRVTGTDLRDEQLVQRRLVTARGRARFEPSADRSWVATPRPDDLDRRLDERDERAEIRRELAAEAVPTIGELRGW